MRGSRLFPESARCDPSAPGRGRASRRIFRERHPELDRPLEQGRRALCRHGRLFSQRTQPVRAGRDVGQGGPFGLHVLPLHGRSGAQGDSLADREGPAEHGAAERQHQLRASREAARRARRRSVGTEVRVARLGPLLRSGRGRSGRAAGDDDQADCIIEQVGEPPKVPITSLGWSPNHIESSTLLEPFMRLYNRTGEKRYLDFARYIVSTGGSEGYDIFRQAYDNVPPHEMAVPIRRPTR